MAVDSLIISGEWPLRASYGDSSLGGDISRIFGRDVLPPLGCGLTFGTGPNQANRFYCLNRTLVTVTYDLLDLSGSLVDAFGNTISLTALKLAIVAIDAPDGTKKVYAGPQNQTHAVKGPWGSATDANCYREVTNWDAVVNEPVAGYAVVGGATDVFPVYNPTGSSVDYWILLVGVG